MGIKQEADHLSHIDGLRALSVMAIFLFHINSEWLPGGFLGVDVFFIISGFVITNLFVHQISDSGKLDFKEFYIRRIRRLFPSFLLVAIISIVASFYLFEISTYKQIAKSLYASLLGFSNIFFYGTSDYFNSNAGPQPFLHYWSLNLEEQFYILWPLLFLFYFRKFGSKSFYLLQIALLLFIFSFAINLYYPTAVFYLPIFRFYLFIFGGFLAYVRLNKKYSLKNQHPKLYAGLIVIIICFYTLTSGDILPGFLTLPLILGSGLLIIFGETNSGFNPLNSRILQFIGLRSYTIYLVHWPVIVFYKEIRNVEELTLVSGVVIIIVAVVFATLIYDFYENPIRQSQLTFKKMTASFLPITATLAIVSLSAPSWASSTALVPALSSPTPTSPTPSITSPTPSVSSATPTSPTPSVSSATPTSPTPSLSTPKPSISSPTPSLSSPTPNATTPSPNALRTTPYSDAEIEAGMKKRLDTQEKICSQKAPAKCDERLANSSNVLIIGDSHSTDALNAMATEFPELNYSRSSTGGCVPTKNISLFLPRDKPTFLPCSKLIDEKWFNLEFLKQFNLIVINVLFTEKYKAQDLVAYLDFLKKSGVNKVVVFGGFYTFKTPLPQLINTYGFDKSKILGFVRDRSIDDQFVQAESSKLGYFFVSKRKAFCKNDDCQLWLPSGIPISWDMNHLSFEFSSMILHDTRNELEAYIN